METPPSPIEFARRARRVHGDRLAVVDGQHRWNYAEFFARCDGCDRWSCCLQDFGIRSEAASSMALRNQTPEPVFGIIKWEMGYRQSPL